MCDLDDLYVQLSVTEDDLIVEVGQHHVRDALAWGAIPLASLAAAMSKHLPSSAPGPDAGGPAAASRQSSQPSHHEPPAPRTEARR